MNLQGNINTVRFVVLLLALSLFMKSCKKGAEETPTIIQEGAAKVMINLIGTAASIEELPIPAGVKSARSAAIGASVDRITSQRSNTEETQEQVIQLNDGLIVTATLVPQANHVKTGSAVNGKVMAVGKTMAMGDAERGVLANGIQYKVIAYNPDGSFKAEQNYSYGSTETTVGLALDADVEYTFVVYSVNSTTVLPTVTGTTLTTAKLAGVTGDLMYFQKKMKVTEGNNYLNVILRHKFSQITTNIELSPETQGNILSINTTAFQQTHINVDFKLSDSVITYGAARNGGTSAEFPVIPAAGVRSLSSTPTLLISPATTTATFSIGATSNTANIAQGTGDVIGNTSRTNNSILSGFKINPGRKYNLNLRYAIPCTQNVSVGTNFNWQPVGQDLAMAPRTILAPGADFGFVFDMINVDNSFGMNINGTDLINYPIVVGGTPYNVREINFQTSNPRAAYPQNIQFADGSIWESGGIRHLWEMTGTAVNPVIRLVISAEGKVSMYGSKVAGGQLYPLKLKTGINFNTITWNKTGANTVIITQAGIGVSKLIGKGYGQKIAVCP